jgi:hypothetical protein
MRLLPHPIISGIVSVAFVVVVQLFAAPRPIFRFLLPAFLLYLGLVTIYHYIYLKRHGIFNWWLVIRPLLFLSSWFGLFFIIPDSFWRGVFLLVGVPVTYLLERMLGHQGEQLLFNETLLSAFAGLMTVTALSHYYALPSTLYLFAAFVFMLLLIRASFESMPQSKQVKWTSAVCLALALAEVFWAASFLPLHYSALGLLAFNVFYCTWTLCYYFLYNHLTAKKIQFHVILALLFTAVVAAVTPWRILQ